MQSFKLIGLALIITCFTSCTKSDSTPPNPNITFTATLSAANEVPPNTSTGTGNATVVFNNDTKILTSTVNYSGLTGPATASHIHKGPPTCQCPVVFGFTSLASPINYTSVALDATQEADLKANGYYVNVHTAANPGGEIRGQLIKQ